MRKEILTGLRDKLKAYLPEFKHIIGVKDTIAQSDYPFISYVYSGESPEGDNETVLRIHLYFGILQKDFDKENGEYLGHTQILQLIETIKAFIYNNRTFAPYVMDSYIDRIATDGGLQHPRYEGEIILFVRAYDRVVEPEPLTKVITVENPDGETISEVSS